MKGGLCPCVPTTELPLSRTPNLTCCSLTRCLLLESENEFPSSTVETHIFHQDLTAGPKQRKTKAERKHITSKHGPSCGPYLPQGQFRKLLLIFHGKENYAKRKLAGESGQTETNISSLCVIFFHSSKIN